MEQYHETILVVEDDVQIRNFICYALKAEGFTCLTAGNAASAMKLLLSSQPDMILLDLGLPDTDGVDIIKKIRTWSNMPIIVISARNEDKDKIEALDAGAEDFVEEEDSFEILTAPEDFGSVHQALEEAGITMAAAEVTMIPQTYVELTDEKDIANIQKTLDMLDDDDDVQNVYHNWDE